MAVESYNHFRIQSPQMLEIVERFMSELPFEGREVNWNQSESRLISIPPAFQSQWGVPKLHSRQSHKGIIPKGVSMKHSQP